MASTASNCACGCNPCVCFRPPGTDAGCLPVSCVPRPCFFDGQLIGADDMNAIVGYFRAQGTLLARLLGGWGILGGLKVDAPANAAALGKALHLAIDNPTLMALTPNPQILAGTTISVSAGAAIDALGRTLVVCEPVTLDVQALARQSSGGTLRAGTCDAVIGPYCGDAARVSLVATEFFLVAELVERLERPAPKFSGGGPCDPPPTCDYSRKLEEVRFSLVGSIPETYQYTGCLEPTDFELPGVLLGQESDADLCREEVFAFIDNVQGQLASECCGRPGVVVAKVLLIRDPGTLAERLPEVPLYTVILDSYPCRKMTMQPGLFTKFFPNLICPSVGM